MINPYAFWLLLFLPYSAATSFYDNPEQDPLPATSEFQHGAPDKWDFESFSGVSTFAHLQNIKCLVNSEFPFDLAILGAPFDTTVSYRPGARFGPKAIRAASARQSRARGYSPVRHHSPYATPLRIVDCGDIPLTPFDNAVALRQMTEAFTELGSRSPASPHLIRHPRILTLGGDHSVLLGALRALRKIYDQPITLVHFDAHQDTWNPNVYPTSWPSEQAKFTHGTMLWMASIEGLTSNSTSTHAGLRSLLTGPDDYEEDDKAGYLRIHADDIDEIGTQGIIDIILNRVGTEVPVYLSIDIDVVDSSLCPGTGTPEPGGWTSRELIRILRGLEKLNVVGADVVEVAPAYDGAGEQTALTAARIVYEVLVSITSRIMKAHSDSERMFERDEL